MRHSVICTAALLVLVAAPSTAQPNSGPGGRVYGLVGGGFGDGTFVATGAGAGLRLTRHLGLDLELLHLSGGRHRLGYRPDVPAVVDGHRNAGTPPSLAAGGRPRKPPVGDDGRRPGEPGSGLQPGNAGLETRLEVLIHLGPLHVGRA